MKTHEARMINPKAIELPHYQQHDGVILENIIRGALIVNGKDDNRKRIFWLFGLYITTLEESERALFPVDWNSREGGLEKGRNKFLILDIITELYPKLNNFVSKFRFDIFCASMGPDHKRIGADFFSCQIVPYAQTMFCDADMTHIMLSARIVHGIPLNLFSYSAVATYIMHYCEEECSTGRFRKKLRLPKPDKFFSQIRNAYQPGDYKFYTKVIGMVQKLKKRTPSSYSKHLHMKNLLEASDTKPVRPLPATKEGSVFSLPLARELYKLDPNARIQLDAWSNPSLGEIFTQKVKSDQEYREKRREKRKQTEQIRRATPRADT